MVIYALFGTSRPLSVSTTATLAILTAAALGQVAPGGGAAQLAIATATLTLLVGIFLGLAALLKLGFVANFISEPVLTGFKGGIAIVIVLDQLPKLIGLHVVKGSFFHNVYALVTGLPHASVATVVVGMVTVAVLVALEHFYPKSPAPLIAVACGIAGVGILGLPKYGVGIVGHIPTGLPSIVMPDLSLIEALWPAAAGIALMSFTETIASGRAFVQSGARATAESGTHVDGPWQCSGRAAGLDAVGRRDYPDGGQSPCGCAFATGGIGDGCCYLGHHAVARAPDWSHAARDACRCSDRLFNRALQTCRFPPTGCGFHSSANWERQ
jgi:hypothetical protein